MGVTDIFALELHWGGSAFCGTRGRVGVVHLLGQQPSHSLEVSGEGAGAEDRAAYVRSCPALYKVCVSVLNGFPGVVLVSIWWEWFGFFCDYLKWVFWRGFFSLGQGYSRRRNYMLWFYRKWRTIMLRLNWECTRFFFWFFCSPRTESYNQCK